MNETKKPAIRFQGFSDEWKQSRVGELIEDYTEKTVVQNQYPVLTSSQQQGIVRQEEYFADRQVTTNDNVGYFVLPFGYFTYRSRSDTDVFVFNRNNLIDKGIISYYYPVFAPMSCDSNFLLRRLNYGIKKQLSMAAEGTGQKVLAHSKFKDMIVDVPDEKEQIKIGAIFEYVDNLIAQHQSKLEKLQAVKASMLEKMFPKDGADVPEVRFKEFNGAWERRKVGDFLTESRIVGHTGQDAKKLTVKLWGKGVVEKTDIFSGSVHTQYYIRKNGQFMYGKLDFLHAAFGIVPPHLDGYESTLDSPAFDLFNIDGQFLMNTVTQKNFYLKNGIIANGSRKAKRIHVDTFLEMDILTPGIEEQIKIGGYFLQIDNLIISVQQELSKLQSIKKALLEKMFV